MPVGDPSSDFEIRVPEANLEDALLVDGHAVRYFYGFSRLVLASKELRGFTIQVPGKTAQAPPYFFGVEATASGQHGTRYLTGVVEADYLDEGTDDESDLVSTDRQELDWEDDRTQPLLAWGAQLTRDALRTFAQRKGNRTREPVLANEIPRSRIDALEKPARVQLTRFLETLGQSDADEERLFDLADSLIRAFEYRHFHDVIEDIEAVGDDPDQLAALLEHIKLWKVMESRADSRDHSRKA